MRVAVCGAGGSEPPPNRELRTAPASKQVAAVRNVGVGGGVVSERPFGGLNTYICHGLLGGALQIAVAARGDADHRAFGDVENLVVDLKAAAAAEDDVVLFVVAVAVEKRRFGARGERAERDFARCGVRGLFREQFACEGAQIARRDVGELFTLVENLDFVHDKDMFINFANGNNYPFDSAKLCGNYRMRKNLPRG